MRRNTPCCIVQLVFEVLVVLPLQASKPGSLQDDIQHMHAMLQLLQAWLALLCHCSAAAPVTVQASWGMLCWWPSHSS